MKKSMCDCLLWLLGTIRIEVGTSGLFDIALYSCVRHNEGLNKCNKMSKRKHVFFYLFISNFCRVLNVVCCLLGNSPASEFYMQTFRNTLSVPSS